MTRKARGSRWFNPKQPFLYQRQRKKELSASLVSSTQIIHISLFFSLFLFARTHTTRSRSLLFRFHCADASDSVLFRQTLILLIFCYAISFSALLPIAIMVVNFHDFNSFILISYTLHCLS